MQNAPPVQKATMRALTAFFASACLSFVLASVIAFLACCRGILFSGTATFLAVFATTALCAVVSTVTALGLKRRQRHFTLRALFIEVLVLAVIAVSLLSWLQTRQSLAIFMHPAPVPSGTRVLRGRSVLFGSYMHFTAPADAVAKLLQSKGLAEVPPRLSDKSDVSGFSKRERTKVSNGWWQPAAMSTPRFFFRPHTNEGVQGWCEGWWVNDATNEVYAFINE